MAELSTRTRHVLLYDLEPGQPAAEAYRTHVIYSAWSPFPTVCCVHLVPVLQTDNKSFEDVSCSDLVDRQRYRWMNWQNWHRGIHLKVFLCLLSVAAAINCFQTMVDNGLRSPGKARSAALTWKDQQQSSKTPGHLLSWCYSFHRLEIVTGVEE